MKHDQRLKAAILRVASKSPEFRKALVAQLKTADVEAVRNTAFNVARKLQGQVKELPIDKIPTLRNYRDPKLMLDPAAESAYLVKGIDVEWEFDTQDYPGINISDPQDHVTEDVEGTFSVLFIPCLTKGGGRPAMQFELSEQGKFPWQDLHDRDYRIRRWQDKEIVDWIKQSFEGILEAEFWEKNDEEEDYRYASAPVSILTPPKFDANQYRYFKGPGKTLMRTWRERKENPKWNLINRVVEHFEGYKYLREKPGWEDQEQTVSIMDAMDKLTKYRDHLYPGGKPKKVRKKTPRMMFLEMMAEPEIKSLISKFSRIFKGKPAEAAQFAYDVLEDANFHTDGRSMNVAMADFSGTTRIAPSAVAQKLGWDSTVLPFAVGIVSGAGDKRGAAQMLKAFVQNNKEWLTPAD